jgi:hypothetical protein
MPKKKQATNQYRDFRKAARDLGCNQDEDRFKDALRTIGKRKPLPEKEHRRSAEKQSDRKADK